MLRTVSHKKRRCLIRPWQLPCDKSFVHLLPESCSSRSVMLWVRFTVDIFPLPVQDHLALADTSYDSSSSRDRANEVSALQTSAWWPQEQARTVKGQAGVGHDGPTPCLIPEERLISLYVLEQAQAVNQLLLSPVSSLVPFLKKKKKSTSFIPAFLTLLSQGSVCT